VVWWNKGIEKVGASRAGIFMNGIPIFAMLLSFLLLGEEIAFTQILGSVMVISGVYLNSLR
jgi:drug/metabolite transporter (DMT)-like permease